MTAKRQSPVEVRNPGARIGASGLSLFQPLDIANLASAAKRSLAPDADCWTFARSLDQAFLRAHLAAVTNERSAPPAELRDAFDAVARAGKAFLFALGVEDAAKTIVRDRELVAREATCLGALVRYAPDLSSRLPDDVIDALAPPDQSMDENSRRELAGLRFIVEAARSAAYVVLVAEAEKAAMSSIPRRSGPTKQAFAPRLLELLVECYWQQFGQLPELKHVSTRDGGYLGGPAVNWLREVLKLAVDRICVRFAEKNQMAGAEGSGTVRLVCANTGIAEANELVESIRSLMKIKFDTLVNHFVGAIQRVKRSRRLKTAKPVS